MFIVLYHFEVKAGHENQFTDHWARLTELIYRYEQSLGSRLHRTKNGEYIAYAQWTDKQSWKRSGDHLPAEAKEIRRELRNSCENISIAFKMDVINDKLHDKPFSEY